MLFSGGFTGQWFMGLLYSIPAILIALSFHECAHAFIAYKMGDPTAKNLGRLTLDPSKHLDLIGTISMILFRFGWAKPVPINPRNFKNPKRDEILVSIAGVITNLLVSFVAYAVLFFMLNAGFSNAIVINIISPIVTLNIYLAIFNMIPIPPLDGFHVISALFIRKAGQAVHFLYRYGFIILIILLLTGVISFILGFLLNGILFAYDSFFGLFV